MFQEHRYHSRRMNYGGCGSRGGKFGGPFGRHFGHHAQNIFDQNFRRVPANIEETEDSFIITLFAPALVKEYLKVATKDEVLTVAYTPKEDAEPIGRFSRKEYSNGAFERSFALNGKVLADHITAGYTDGILTVTLPKNPETNTPEQDISVD